MGSGTDDAYTNRHVTKDTVTVYSEGVKHDKAKARVDLLPTKPLLDIAAVLQYGSQKYEERNWEKGIKYSRVYGAALRHLFAWQSGETNDPETGLNHLSHAACNLLFLLEFEKTHPELDDRPRKE